MSNSTRRDFWLAFGKKSFLKMFQLQIGPVVGITTFKTEEEAIEIANSTKFGLSATLWTENVRRAHRVASQIDSGTVWINCWMNRDCKKSFFR